MQQCLCMKHITWIKVITCMKHKNTLPYEVMQRQGFLHAGIRTSFDWSFALMPCARARDLHVSIHTFHLQGRSRRTRVRGSAIVLKKNMYS